MQKAQKNHGSGIAAVLAAILFALVLAGIAISRRQRVPAEDALASGDIVRGEIVLADGRRQLTDLPATVQTTDPFSLFIQVPAQQHKVNQSLFIWTAYTDLAVILDGQVIYFYQPFAGLGIKSGGYAVRVVDLPPDETGASTEVELRFTPRLKSIGSHKLQPVFYGRRIAVLEHQLLAESLKMFLIIAIFSVFLLAALIVLFGFFRDEYQGRMMAVGLACLLISLYFVAQLWAVNYALRQAPLALYIVEYSALMLMGAPFLALLHGRISARTDRLLRLGILASPVNFCLQHALSLMGIIEYKQLLTPTQVILLAQIVLAAATLLLADSRRTPAYKKALFWSLAPILVVGLAAIVYYWTYGRFLPIELALLGVLLFVVVQFYQAAREYSHLQQETLKKQVFEQMAMTDELTGLGSRAAYRRFIDSFKALDRDSWVVSLDLNNLKQVNDQQGHAAGDQLLRCFAQALQEALAGAIGTKLFRVGGDEFAAFIEKPRTFDMDKLLAGVNEHIATCCHGAACASFAAGYSYYQAGGGQSIQQVIADADACMYAEKGRQKRAQASLAAHAAAEGKL